MTLENPSISCYNGFTLGAFLGFRLIAEKISEILPGEQDLSYTDAALWERHTLEDWFLGSRGKRVGIYFNGVDDYSWLTPTFPTQMSTAIESSGKVYSGNFEAANLRLENVSVRDYHNINVYCNYIGGDIAIPEENTVSLGYGRVYHLEFDDFLSDNPELTETMVAILPEGSSQPTNYHIFDLAACREEGSFSWYFTTPRYGSQRLKLVFLDGKSLYGSAVYQNVTLSTASYT